jgi:hypothetical protein
MSVPSDTDVIVRPEARKSLTIAGLVQAELHRELMAAAIERDADAQRALLAGDDDRARAAFGAAAGLYRASWEAAPPASYGRLVGMLKSAILAGSGREAGDYVRGAIADSEVASPTAAYARAIAALVAGDDRAARTWGSRIQGASEAFDRTANAIVALASRDRAAYAEALEAIVRDFERRTDHLTGVAIADTALMLDRLAADRGMTAPVSSLLLPKTSS